MEQELPYILLADDDPDDQEVFCDAFTRLNPHACVKIVGDGNELFEFLDGCTVHELPALILIDFKMPLVTGPEILQRLDANNIYRAIPKLIWSTSVRSKDIEECKRLGADDYLKKPATVAETDGLTRQINSILTALQRAK
jgi:CheY-like chemotaxis protein